MVNQHNETYTFSRNKAGDIIAETGFDELTRHYLRSAAGRVLGVKGPGGMDTKYRYNGKGQLSYIDYSDGSWETYSYDKDGLLISAQNEHSHVSFKHDRNGRIVTETQSRGIADKGYSISSSYDKDGLRLHIGSSLGADIAHQYNNQGHLVSIQAKSGEQHWQAHIERNAWGQATAYEFTGGVQCSFAYDSAGRPVAHTVKTGAGRESYKRSYHWNSANQLVQNIDYLKNRGTGYTYDALNQLVSAKIGSSETELKNPDAVGNLYETADRTDRKYERGGRLEKAKNWHYYYDTLGNLKLKSPFPLHGKEPSKKWQPGSWYYEWYANGMLKSVQKPGGTVVSFEYDALGRRIAKICKDTITRYVWDGNVLLHEWSYALGERPVLQVGELGELFYDKAEPIENVITWVYEQGSFTPIAKLVNGERYSIVSDYLGTPTQAYDSGGTLVWERELNIYGGVRKETGIANFVPMRYQGQYFDEETGLCYNRFRYYDSATGLYISQDPIRLQGGKALYGYVHDANGWVDPLGLSEYTFKKIPFSSEKDSSEAYDLVAKAQSFRKSLGTTTGTGAKHAGSKSNVAVVEYKDSTDNLRYLGAIADQRGGGHAEAKLAQKLKDLGVSPDKVTRIYTELEPCDVCGPLVRDFKNAKVFYSFDYNPTGLAEWKETVNKIFFFFR